jgi:hypothetical protein
VHRFEYDARHADLVERKRHCQPANAAAGDKNWMIRHTLDRSASRWFHYPLDDGGSKPVFDHRSDSAANVRNGSFATHSLRPDNFRFAPDSRHITASHQTPLWAMNRREPMQQGAVSLAVAIVRDMITCNRQRCQKCHHGPPTAEIAKGK